MGEGILHPLCFLSNQVMLGEFLGATITFCFHTGVARAVVSTPGTCQTNSSSYVFVKALL